jgi:hypothetical protein
LSCHTNSCASTAKEPAINNSAKNTFFIIISLIENLNGSEISEIYFTSCINFFTKGEIKIKTTPAIKA